MSYQPDYSILDEPEILQFVFYPRSEWTPLPPGARDFLVPVGAEVSISCRFYPAKEDSPCIIFFHGNGEVACDYDFIAPLYQREGISLFVADYRGYGLSGGRPSFSTMIADAHSVLNFFIANVRPASQNVPLFLMGRSLGSHSAVELASHYPQYFAGLIVESGSANMVRLLRFLSSPVDSARVKELEEVSMSRIRSITLPALIIHGEADNLIPVSEGIRLFNTIGSKAKRLVTVPGAGHNDLLLVGMEQYFSAIRDFVFPCKR